MTPQLCAGITLILLIALSVAIYLDYRDQKRRYREMVDEIEERKDG